VFRAAAPLACAALLSSAVVALQAQSPARVSITGVTLVDVVGGRLEPNRTITIAGDTIESIADGGAAPRGARVVDGRGKFLIPGLWDMHAHHEGVGDASLPLYVAQGVTGTRDMGSALEIILAMRTATASGRVLGPRIIAAGPILDDAPDGWPFRMRVRTEADGRAAVRLLKERGVDFIKVHSRTSRDAYFGIADEAKRLGLVVAGHVPTRITFEEAAMAGQRSIEHLASFRVFRDCSGGREYKPEACRAFFTWLRDRGIWQTPTLASWKYLMVAGTTATSAATDYREYASPSLRALWIGNQRQRENQLAFLAGVAHDLRNPIAALKMAIHGLQAEQSEARRTRTLAILDRQMGHLARMIDDLLDATRIEAGRLELHLEDVNLRDVVENVVRLYAPTAPDHDVRVTASDAGVMVHADPFRLEQVLSNLLSNAIKFSPAGGAVEVRVEIEDAHAMLSVTDHGIGISPEVVSELFTPFRRHRPDVASGAGLGLSIVRRIVSAHGGSVDVESQPGSGATFRVRLPLIATATTEAASRLVG
jgi:signal transduction histidine kinase